MQNTLDDHEAAGTTDSQAYQDAVMVFYMRHLCRLDPWPDEVLTAFALANFDLTITMWGNTEFNATGTLRDYDATARLGKIRAPTLFTCGEFDEATPRRLPRLRRRDFGREGRGRRRRLPYGPLRAARGLHGRGQRVLRRLGVRGVCERRKPGRFGPGFLRGAKVS